MSNFRTLDDLGDVKGKVALVRVDLNLPMQDGSVTDDTRVRASAPTILELADAGAKVLLLAHFGRPKGARDPNQSLSRVIDAVQNVLGREVMYCSEIAGDIVKQTVAILRPGDIAILENTRFWPGEEKNDPELVKGIAANADLYAAPLFHLLKIPTDLNTPLFACSRVIGWAAHVIEQQDKNRLIRPRSRYTGPGRRSAQ